MARGDSCLEESFDFVQTPSAAAPHPSNTKAGVRTTDSPAIANAPLPAEGPGRDHFSNVLLLGLMFLCPYYLKTLVGGGFKTFVFFALLTTLPILVGFWAVVSLYSPRKDDLCKLPGRNVEEYLSFTTEEGRKRFHGRNKIPMETFHEMYFEGEVDLKGDCLEILEYRHDWATFNFTIGLFKHFLLGFIPEMLVHSRNQDEEQVRDHYDRGDDFYAWFLGPRMIYTSGIISDPTRSETLEELQDNKLKIVCSKLSLKPGDRLLDLGSGWGTLARFASLHFGAHVTGITLGKNQTAWGNSGLQRDGIPASQSRILCMDYRDTPRGKYDKITCLEMAEHVGVRHFGSFLRQVYGMLEDEGTFFLQIAGLRKCWQYEDFTWGLFLNKYIFPGADASTPLGWFVDSLEAAGFEVAHIDTIGVHYSATIWRWYRNWLANAEKVKEKYGLRWYRIWEYFLAYSTIASRQGSGAVYQIVLHKNLNRFHRVEKVPAQFALTAALAQQVPKMEG